MPELPTDSRKRETESRNTEDIGTRLAVESVAKRWGRETAGRQKAAWNGGYCTAEWRLKCSSSPTVAKDARDRSQTSGPNFLAV